MSITSTNLMSEEQELEITLRPKSLDEYIGQEKVRANLQILMEAAKRRGEPINM